MGFGFKVGLERSRQRREKGKRLSVSKGRDGVDAMCFSFSEGGTLGWVSVLYVERRSQTRRACVSVFRLALR